MRGLLLGVSGLVATLLLPLLLIGALLGSLSSTPTDAAPDLATSVADLPVPAAFTGSDTDCTATDPTGGRCLTPATRHAYDEIVRAFGPPGRGQPIRSAGCWDAHAWNPTSDHPKGKACDFTIGTAGQFPTNAQRVHGWQVATWLKDNATALDVAYVIWDGQIWSARQSSAGWRRYTGGGVYDASTPTGGHFDHVHERFNGKWSSGARSP